MITRILPILTLAFLWTACAANLDPVQRAKETNFHFNIHDVDPQQIYQVYFRDPDGKIVQRDCFIRKSSAPGHVTLLSQHDGTYTNTDMAPENIVYVTPEVAERIPTEQRTKITLIVVGGLLLAGVISASILVANK